MTMAVRNRARETITALGGLCCRPSAVRSSDSTTTIRTKRVVMMTIDGASDRTVIRPTSWTTRSVRPAPVPRSMLMADPDCAAAWAMAATGRIRPRARLTRVTISDRRRRALQFGAAGQGEDGRPRSRSGVRPTRLDQHLALAQQDQPLLARRTRTSTRRRAGSSTRVSTTCMRRSPRAALEAGQQRRAHSGAARRRPGRSGPG